MTEKQLSLCCDLLKKIYLCGSNNNFFAYYNRSLGANSYLCMRKIKSTGKFKPYAIINQKTFDTEIKNVHKTKPQK